MVQPFNFILSTKLGDSDVEHTDIVSDVESEEMVEVQKENTMYDNLLKKLESVSEPLATANKRRYVNGYHCFADAVVWVTIIRLLPVAFFSFLVVLYNVIYLFKVHFT